MIVDANTIVDPLAVVVKLVNASIADVTVPRVLLVYGLAVGAQALRVIFFYQLVKVKICNFLHVARGPEGCAEEKYIYY